MDELRTVLLGLPTTLLVTACSLAVGTLLAIPLMFGLRSQRRAVRFLSRVFVDIVRGIPPIVWLFILFYGISLGAVRLPAMIAGIGGLGLVATGYLAEIFRGSLKALDSGQWEGANALGLDGKTTWISIIAPQAWRTALPGYTNYGIALLKDSSIVSIIGVSEVLNRTAQLSRTSSSGIFVYAFAAALYIALSVPLGTMSRAIDQRLRKAVAA